MVFFANIRQLLGVGKIEFVFHVLFLWKKNDTDELKYNKYEHFLQKQRPIKIAVFLFVANDEVPFFFVDNIVERFFVCKTLDVFDEDVFDVVIALVALAGNVWGE